MADITEIRELAKKLDLWNIARGYIDLNDEKLSNLDYLQMILQKELEIRARQKQIKLRRASKLPNKVFECIEFKQRFGMADKTIIPSDMAQ